MKTHRFNGKLTAYSLQVLGSMYRSPSDHFTLTWEHCAYVIRRAPGPFGSGGLHSAYCRLDEAYAAIARAEREGGYSVRTFGRR